MGQPKLRYALLLARWLKYSLLPNKNHRSKSEHTLLSGELFSHAIKTPLGVIIGNLEFVEDNQLAGSERKTAVQRCLIAARKLELLLKHLDNPEDSIQDIFDVKSALEQVAVIAESRYPESRVVIDVPNCLITGTKLYFQEALQCLVNNGLEAQMRLSIKAKLIVSGTIVADKLRLDIIDHGHGMTLTETRLAIMKGMTYRAGGSGLGLPFALETIKRYFHGCVSISSSREIGTRVVVEIPI